MYKRTIMFLCFLLFPAVVFPQAEMVHFNYDANGNRTGRTLTVQRMEEISIPFDTLETLELAKATSDSFGQATLSIFPNPTHNKLNVVLDGLGCVATASLITLAGEIVERRELFDGAHSFNMKDLPSGIYLLHLSSPSDSQTWKIIKN